MAPQSIFTPERCRRVPAPRICRTHRSRSIRALCCLAAAAPLFGGCSLSFPIAPLVQAEEVTGSSSPVPFGQLLDEEGRRREKAALSTALDPQGDGATVHWENTKSGAKGAITAVGRAYPWDGKVCRAFLGDLTREAGRRTLQGTACAVAAGDWQVRDSKPFAKQ